MPTTSMPWLSRNFAASLPINPAEPVTTATDIGLLQDISGRPSFYCADCKIQSKLTLEPIAMLTGDFEFPARGNERIDEVDAQIRPVIVLVRKRMPAGSRSPCSTRFDVNDACSGAHFLKYGKRTADEIEMLALPVCFQDDLPQDLICVGPSFGAGNPTISIRIDERENHRRDVDAGRQVQPDHDAVLAERQARRLQVFIHT